MAIQDELQGSSALLTRALNEDVRSSGIQFGRGLFVAAGLWVAIVAAMNRLVPGAPGLLMFQNILLADLMLVYFVAIPYFAGAITEEREQGTLGLLKLSGISPLGLLLGKSVSRLIGVCLGLILQIPFILLAVTFGGVTYHQIGAAMTGLLAFLFLLNNICLFASLCRPTTKEATGVVRSFLILWIVLPRVLIIPALILLSLGKFSPLFTSLGNLLQSCVTWLVNLQFPFRLFSVTSSTFEESWLSWQVIIDLALGLLFFIVARRRFEPLTFDVEPVAERPAQKKSKPLIRLPAAATALAAPAGISAPCRNNPFFWKEFHFRCGGWRGLKWQWTKLLLTYAGLSFFLILLSMIPILWGTQFLTIQRAIWTVLPSIGGMISFFSGVGFAKVFVTSFSDSFTEELRQKTYASLLLTPNDTRRITFSTLLGRLMGCLPHLFWFCAGFTLLLLTAPGSPQSPTEAVTVGSLMFFAKLFWIGCSFLLWLFYIGLWGEGIAVHSGKWLATFFFVGLEFLIYIGTMQFFWTGGWQQEPTALQFVLVLFSLAVQAFITITLIRRIPITMRVRMGD